MEITVSQEQGRVPVTVIHLKGNVDSSTYEEFQTRADQLVADGAHDILLDLRDVPYMSSAGLRVLNQLYNALGKADAGEGSVSKGVSAGTYKSSHLKLLAPNQRVLETLKMSGYDMLLDIHHSQKDAVASFGAK